MIKTTKKLVAILLVVVMALSSFPIAAFAATEYVEGNFTYTVSDSKATIVSYPETAEGVVNIPSTLGGYPVTAIGSYAFWGCTLITEISIPASITLIENGAFGFCTYLAVVNYAGTEAQWKKISIGSGNSDLTDAKINYGTSGDITGDLLFPTGKKWNEVDNYEYTYNDNYFLKPSNEYNHDLALMSIALEGAACVPDGAWDGEFKLVSDSDYSNKEPINADILFKKIKFEEIGKDKYYEPYGYADIPEFNSVANIVAAKNIDDSTTVVAVAVRGIGYEAEWGGNFNMGKSGRNHQGFDIAKEKVLDNIDDFVAKYGSNFKSNVKIWITGYSRGAAVANLVAAALNDGISSSIYPNVKSLNITKEKVYCYTFETPLNTTYKYANSAYYNNIFSIANPIDPVTKVAPASDGFNFKRYGITYYLPTVETVSSYDTVKNNMSKVRKNIYGDDYKEDFTFYEFHVKTNWLWGVVPTAEIEIVENDSIGQMTYLNNLIDILATEGFENREYYYNTYQGAVMKLMAMAMGGYDISNKEEFVYAIANAMTDYFMQHKYLDLNPVQILKEDIALVIATCTEISFSEAVSLLGQIDDLLLVIISHPNYALTTFKNLELMFYPHYSSIFVGWMAYLDTLSESLRNKLLNPSLKYRVVKVNCPVNVNVYDSFGNLVASVVDDEVISINGKHLSTYIDENGQKCVVMPDDDKYEVKVIARENCEVSCSISEMNGEILQEEKVVNYYDILMDSGDVITCTIEDKNEVTECKYPIVDDEGKAITPDDVLEGEEIETYTVEVNSNIDEIIVMGGGEFTVGEFAQLTAHEVSGYKFDGWYINGSLVSNEFQYRFCVKDDVSALAKYEKTSDEPICICSLSIKTPSRNEIRNKDGIILHANVECAPADSYVVWTSSNGNFDTDALGNGKLEIIAKNKGWTTFTATLYDADGNVLGTDSVEMYSKSGFFDKIGGFFRSLFGTTKMYDVY